MDENHIREVVRDSYLQFWMRHVPRCPSCRHEQVQLLAGYTSLAEWRCRMCKHRFGTKFDDVEA